eukprot:TRINITY_DN4668_c0_g3_i1.p1 TRINITY_DN4668_c0_g3~~TRINITY_DN4668_c0_g3_i1.p1  ORF type:complete len:888 (-),score=248.65 TRINITY_DN4668_c0_g3_i1:210-2702(-)
MLLNSKGIIVSVIDDPESMKTVGEIYDIPKSSSDVVGLHFENLFGDAKLIKMNDLENQHGIDYDELWQTSQEYGLWPTARERWMDIKIENTDLSQASFKINVKYFVLDEEFYLLFTIVDNNINGVQCEIGCPKYSKCAEDGLFCICEEASVQIGEGTVFACRPKFVIEPAPAIRFVVFGCFGACFFLTVAVSALYRYNHRTKLVKVSSHLITQMMLFGIGVLFCASMTFAVPVEDYPSVCVLRPIFTMLGLSIALIALFLKTWRIQRLINNSAMKRMNLNNRLLMYYMGYVLIPVILILIIWMIVSRPERVYFMEDNLLYGNPSYAVCSESRGMACVSGIFLIILILWGGINAWKSRNAPLGANESSEILGTLFVFFAYGVILIPLNFMMEDSSQTLMLIVRGFGIMLGGLSVVFAILGKKIGWLLRGFGDDDFVLNMSASSHSKDAFYMKYGGRHHRSGSTSKKSTQSIGGSTTNGTTLSMHRNSIESVATSVGGDTSSGVNRKTKKQLKKEQKEAEKKAKRDKKNNKSKRRTKTNNGRTNTASSVSSINHRTTSATRNTIPEGSIIRDGASMSSGIFPTLFQQKQAISQPGTRFSNSENDNGSKSAFRPISVSTVSVHARNIVNGTMSMSSMNSPLKAALKQNENEREVDSAVILRANAPIDGNSDSILDISQSNAIFKTPSSPSRSLSEQVPSRMRSRGTTPTNGSVKLFETTNNVVGSYCSDSEGGTSVQPALTISTANAFNEVGSPTDDEVTVTPTRRISLTSDGSSMPGIGGGSIVRMFDEVQAANHSNANNDNANTNSGQASTMDKNDTDLTDNGGGTIVDVL